MELIDTHCHLNDERLRDDLELVLARAKEVGVAKMLVVCTDLEEIPAIIDLIQSHEQIYGSVGVHPHEAKLAIEKGYLKRHLEHFVAENKIVALGETGLDYYYEHSPRDIQKQAFQTHI